MPGMSSSFSCSPEEVTLMGVWKKKKETKWKLIPNATPQECLLPIETWPLGRSLMCKKHPNLSLVGELISWGSLLVAKKDIVSRRGPYRFSLPLGRVWGKCEDSGYCHRAPRIGPYNWRAPWKGGASTSISLRDFSSCSASRWNLAWCWLFLCQKMSVFFFHKRGNEASNMLLKVHPPFWPPLQCRKTRTCTQLRYSRPWAPVIWEGIVRWRWKE